MANPFISPAHVDPLSSGADAYSDRFSWEDAPQRIAYFLLVGLTAALLYSYWNMLQLTSEAWNQPQYSHGFIIPLIALYMMWSMRPNPGAQEGPVEQRESLMGLCDADTLRNGSMACGLVAVVGYFSGISLLTGLAGIAFALLCIGMLAYILLGQPLSGVTSAERWIGLAVIVAAYAARIIAAKYSMDPVDRLSFVVALFGLFVLVGGWRLISWAGPAVGFLLFMYPLPTVIEGRLMPNLQKLAAVCSEISLTILGLPVVRQGNSIFVDGMPLNIAEACSGLRMLTIFIAMTVAMAFLIKRPWWDKLIMLLSAIPIAIVSNVLRILAIALLFMVIPTDWHMFGVDMEEVFHRTVHDYAGYAMMIPALGLLFIELKLLSLLSVQEEGIEIHSTGVGAPGAYTPQ
ncbi:Transmembrane exosortase [Pseudobythopirellula maris]|uniref:Transmembrane exosortase n=1 Tax=Pseudobythopirellula maris TaxID=2527991 RepID=A0A5C5ZNG1_9BACT|nr:exosortase/archaeosortase family protein [Pseudobythopirellula maris]TWT88710.1 Transmembrane exosortase [Pseudobythopirellula maris]